MYSPRFCLLSFRGIAPEGRERVLLQLFEALVTANIAYLHEHPETPRLFESGIRYDEEAPGSEDWQDIPETLKRGKGDCEDLACWRIAELRVRDHEHAMAYLKRAERGDRVLYHVAVWRADGRLEDPSRVLGML